MNQYRRGHQDLRRALLNLHKALLDAERLAYERIHGRVSSAGEFLQLAMHDPWFAWLHPLSQLVVRIDALLDEPDEAVVLQDVVEELRELLRPSEYGEGFARSYYDMLQRSPDVVLAHSQVKRLL